MQELTCPETNVSKSLNTKGLIFYAELGIVYFIDERLSVQELSNRVIHPKTS
jgi:hypothetical protein